jgi:putative transposase
VCNEVYENTPIERVNDTIKNQYLKRMEVNNRKEMEEKLDEVIVSYNETRSHQSLQKMSPVEYEKRLAGVSRENRIKMKVYTIKLDKNKLENTQLNLFESL